MPRAESKPTRAAGLRMILPKPMLLSEGTSPLGRPGWLYEVKYDGYRMIAGVVHGAAQISSRGGADYGRAFPEVIEALSSLSRGPHILDGEVVVLNEHGHSDFARLQDRARRRTYRETDSPAVFMAFDLLALDGTPLISESVERRKELLRTLLPHDLPALHYVEHFPAEQGRSLYNQAAAIRLEGLVAKRLGSRYLPGERTTDWVKVKVPGVIPPERFKR